MGSKTDGIKYIVDDKIQVNIFTAPYFIGSKIEAFKSRGKDDGRTSTDFEDIIFVLDNRKEIWNEMKNAEMELYKYLKEAFTRFYKIPYFEEWLTCHLEFTTATARVNMILTAMKEFIR